MRIVSLLLALPACSTETTGDPGVLAEAKNLGQGERFCADQNGDGLVSRADFNAWILNYNLGCN